jgi:hypothetical protein
LRYLAAAQRRSQAELIRDAYKRTRSSRLGLLQRISENKSFGRRHKASLDRGLALRV